MRGHEGQRGAVRSGDLRCGVVWCSERRWEAVKSGGAKAVGAVPTCLSISACLACFCPPACPSLLPWHQVQALPRRALGSTSVAAAPPPSTHSLVRGPCVLCVCAGGGGCCVVVVAVVKAGHPPPTLNLLSFACIAPPRTGPNHPAGPFLKNPAQGAATTIYAATAPELAGKSGAYLVDCAVAKEWRQVGGWVGRWACGWCRTATAVGWLSRSGVPCCFHPPKSGHPHPYPPTPGP